MRMQALDMIDVIGSTPWLFKQPNGAKDEVMGGARSKPARIGILKGTKEHILMHLGMTSPSALIALDTRL